jgi:hypothetical protein
MWIVEAAATQAAHAEAEEAAVKAAEGESRLDSLTQKREDGKAREASRKEAKKGRKQGM